MATAPAPKTPAPARPPVVEEAQEAESSERPTFERVNIAGLVLDKTLYSDGECEVTLVDEPQIDPSLIRATRASQRRRGH